MAKLVPGLAGTREQPRKAIEINKLPAFLGHTPGRGGPGVAVRIPDALRSGVREPDAFRTAIESDWHQASPGIWQLET